jgi:asparagine synthase (glutamine-hydrolysing)
MCGIYGVVTRGGPVDATPLAAMDAAMVHRGPDDSGTLVDGPCALGMRRLAIIDLDGGHQPIAGEDRSSWVVLNGEIYNHRELRRRLIARGHRFATASDTEAIVHLYEERGATLCEELRGMFAFAVWDRRAQRLVLGRDRLGIKPLYYAEAPGGLAFASELRALLAHPWVARALDPDALAHYLAFGTAPSDRALVAGVRKLEPGHVLTWAAGVTTVRRYWDLGRAAARPTGGRAGASIDGALPRRLDEGVEQVRALLQDAVTSHLLADVPVGAFLSGGIDSTTVVALMTRAGARPQTFSIGFDEDDFNELRFARLVAERLGTRHEELVVRPEVWGLLDRLVSALDEPIADVSAVPTFLVSELAARHVKVVLSGDGGDEVFGGYDRYPQALAEARRLDRFGPWPRARRAVGRLAEALPERARGKYWLRHVALDPRLRYLDGESLFSPDARRRLTTPEWCARTKGPDPLEVRAHHYQSAPGDALGRLLYLDATTYLPLDILTKVDRMSMAHSLEVRPPLLDTPLVEAVAAMPSAWKVAAGEQKILLKRAVERWLPREIIDRPKRGFGVPIRHWFRGALRGDARAVLDDRRTRERGLLDPRAVVALLDEHASGRRDQSLRIWALLVLELWLRAFLDAPAERAPERRSVPVEAGEAASAAGGAKGAHVA